MVQDDRLVITGPLGGSPRYPGKVASWQPRAWSSHPEDPESKLIGSNEVRIDFGQEFVALEVRTMEVDFARPRFQSVKVEVDVWRGNVHVCERQVWINVSRDEQPWALVR